jgi:GNAT superfamily N-acetyltransferase
MTSLPPPSPLSGPSEISEPAVPEDPLADIPELHSYMARDEAEKTAALKLVADSVAQMRQAANSALIFHPLNIALAVGLMSLVARWVYDAKHDWSLVGTSCAGVLMALLAGYRWCTQGYLHSAEEINWDWIEGADVIVTKFGEEIIGTIVVDWLSGESSRQKKKKAWRGEIRAWTVRLRYRGKGVGAALLEDAVKEARKKSAESLEFAEDHASELSSSPIDCYIRANMTIADSKRILPTIYNTKFDKREKKSRELLQDLLEASPSRGKKR